MRLSLGRSGRTVQRFTALERTAHWLIAGSFIILALTGLNKTFGRQALSGLMSPRGFAELSVAAQEIHHYASFVFSGGLLLVFMLWVRDNVPSRRDIAWIAIGGGLFGSRHPPPAERFNGGQKMLFWSVVVGGMILSATGFSLMFPDAVTSGAAIRLASMIYGLLAALLIGLMIAHAYIGSLGMEGAIQAMTRGRVDVNWAQQHHELWAVQCLVDQGDMPKKTDLIERIEPGISPAE